MKIGRESWIFNILVVYTEKKDFTLEMAMSEVGRNDPCPCGSGKKYKKCCGQKSSSKFYSYSKGDLETSKASIQRIAGLVSQKIRNVNPEAADKLDKGVQEQVKKLDEVAKDLPEKAGFQPEEEDEKNDEESSS